MKKLQFLLTKNIIDNINKMIEKSYETGINSTCDDQIWIQTVNEILQQEKITKNNSNYNDLYYEIEERLIDIYQKLETINPNKLIKPGEVIYEAELENDMEML